ncbi:MAG: CBS domain-containing protein [Phycisphaerales bacterium]|nr:MAG: CBS domain-containing protein [Phycisphaerales bacterium]
MPSATTKHTAKDVMTPDPVCIRPSATIRELARLFEVNEISGAPVINQAGMLIGVVSKTDLIRKCAEGTVDIPPAYLFEALAEQGENDEEENEYIPEPIVCVEDFMTEHPLTVTPETPLREIARAMVDGRFHRVVVVNEESAPIGVITTLDLLATFS